MTEMMKNTKASCYKKELVFVLY